MWNLLREVLRDEDGATAIEYGLIAAVMAVAVVAAWQLLGDEFEGLFTGIMTIGGEGG